MKTGYGSALGDYNWGAVPNMVYVNQNFARGREWTRWTEGDFFSYERYDDKNSSTAPDSGEGLLLVGLNDSGGWQTRNGVQTAFEPGTVLKDYSINGGADVTVNGSGQVNISIPPATTARAGCSTRRAFANGNGDPIRFSGGRQPGRTIPWIVPGGALATNKPRNVVRLTGNTVDIDVHYANPADSAVDAVMVKWGLGQRMHATNYFSPGVDTVSGKFQSANPVTVGGNGGTGQFRLHRHAHQHDRRSAPGAGPRLRRPRRQPARALPDLPRGGLCGPPRPRPAMSSTRRPTRRRGLARSARSPMRPTAYYMEYSVNGGAYTFCDEVQKGSGASLMPDLAPVSTRSPCARWRPTGATPAHIINTSTLSACSMWRRPARRFRSTAPSGEPRIAVLRHHDHHARPSPADVKLYWDGYRAAPGRRQRDAQSTPSTAAYLTGGVTQPCTARSSTARTTSRWWPAAAARPPA
jgi:hypothetical protein